LGAPNFRRAFCPYGQKKEKTGRENKPNKEFSDRVLFVNSRGNIKGGTNEAY